MVQHKPLHGTWLDFFKSQTRSEVGSGKAFMAPKRSLSTGGGGEASASRGKRAPRVGDCQPRRGRSCFQVCAVLATSCKPSCWWQGRPWWCRKRQRGRRQQRVGWRGCPTRRRQAQDAGAGMPFVGLCVHWCTGPDCSLMNVCFALQDNASSSESESPRRTYVPLHSSAPTPAPSAKKVKVTHENVASLNVASLTLSKGCRAQQT